MTEADGGFPSTGSLPKWLQCWELGQVEARSQKPGNSSCATINIVEQAVFYTLYLNLLGLYPITMSTSNTPVPDTILKHPTLSF